MDVAEIRKRKAPRHMSIDLLLDDSLLDDRDAAVLRVKRAEDQERLTGGDYATSVHKHRQALADIEQQIRDATVTFSFKALPRRRWVELMNDHEPEGEDEAFSEEFVRLLIVEASLEPKLTEADVADMFDGGDWSVAETDLLFATAFRANRTIRDIPFTNSSTDPTTGTDSNSTTAPDEE